MAGLIFPALLGFVVGTALQLRQQDLYAWPVYGYFSALALILYGFAARKFVALSPWRLARPALVLIAFALLAAGATGLRSAYYKAHGLDSALEGRDVSVTGVIAAMPQRNESGLRFRFDVESAQLDGKAVRLPPRIYLGWYSGNFWVGAEPADEQQRQLPVVQAGERWRLTVRLKAPHGASNPFGFDYELWMWEQGLQANGYVRSGAKDPPPQRLGHTGWHPVERARQQVRDRIFEQVAERRHAGLIAALVVGDQNAIDRADWDIFRATGVAHLMSISGLHITMFAWLAVLVVGGLWRRSPWLCLRWPTPHAALAGGILLATAYAVFSGWGIPSQRTVLMLAIVGLLRWSGKRWPWPQVWLLACAVVVAIDPWALLQAGFWLSFVAVGVLFAAGSNRAPAHRSEPPSRAGRGLGFAAAAAGTMFRQQWAVTLALAPLSLLLFGQVSLVGLVANALAIPWVTLVITPLAMLGVWVEPLWEVAATAIVALAWVLERFAAFPYSTLFMAQAPLWAGAAGVAGGLMLVIRLPWSLRLLGLPLLLPVLLWQAPRPAQHHFEVLAADVGQGSAVVVQTAGHTLVFDAGPRYSRDSDAGERVLVPLLRALGAKVDVLMLSHRDSDHVGGAPAVLAMQPKAQLFTSFVPEYVQGGARTSQFCQAGQRWRWDGVDFEVLQPQASDYQAARASNAMSCVLRISNGEQAALLTGDVEQAQEARLVADGAALKADVLLVPHHGSKSSSSATFLDAVRPRIALVQAGYRNRFGHPALPVLERYTERGIQMLDSPHCGAASWRSERPQEVRCQRTQALRYWHHRLI